MKTDTEIIGPLITIIFLVAGAIVSAHAVGHRPPEERSPSGARVHCESVCEGAGGYLAEMDVANNGVTTCICLFGVDTE